jgi:dolichyl-phosphate-mannose--protein O-mannosyl transferase
MNLVYCVVGKHSSLGAQCSFKWFIVVVVGVGFAVGGCWLLVVAVPPIASFMSLVACYVVIGMLFKVYILLDSYIIPLDTSTTQTYHNLALFSKK